MPFRRRFKDNYTGSSRERICCPNSVRLVPSTTHSNAMYIQDELRNTPMRELIAHFPDLAAKVLTKCITECPFHNDVDSIDYAVIFNFDLIEDAFLDLRYPHQVAATCCTAEMRHCSAPTRTDPLAHYTQPPTTMKMMEEDATAKKPCPLGWINLDNDPIMMMVQLKRDELFQHPLLEAILGLRRILLYTLDFNRIGFALAFAVFVSIVMTKREEYQKSCWPTTNHVNASLDFCQLNVTCVTAYVAQSATVSFSYTALFALSCVGYLITAAQLMTDGFQCWRLNFLLDLISYTLGALISVDTEFCPGVVDYVVSKHWQWSAGIVCLFLSWVNFVMKMMDIAHVGVFVLMIYEVLKTFAKILIIIVPFVNIFALVFFTMLHSADRSPFGEGGESILKTFVMTLGEIDYATVFAAIRSADFTVFDQFLIISCFVLFLIVMPVIFMNLLLGLAVGDIEKIRRVAGTNDLKIKALGTLRFQYSLPLRWQQKLHAKFSDMNILGGSKIKVPGEGDESRVYLGRVGRAFQKKVEGKEELVCDHVGLMYIARRYPVDFRQNASSYSAKFPALHTPGCGGNLEAQ